METALTESTALSSKSEREYLVLRDSLKSMSETWKHDIQQVREEMTKREERWKKEAEEVGKKYRLLLEEVKASRDTKVEIEKLKQDDSRVSKEMEESWTQEIRGLKTDIEKSCKDSDDAVAMAQCV